MNMGLKILLLHWIMISCASTPKPAVKKKVGTGTTAPAVNTVKGPAPARPAAVKPAAVKSAAVKPATPPPAEEEEVHEEEDDQYSRMKKFYKK